MLFFLAPAAGFPIRHEHSFGRSSARARDVQEPAARLPSAGNPPRPLPGPPARRPGASHEHHKRWKIWHLNLMFFTCSRALITATKSCRNRRSCTCQQPTSTEAGLSSWIATARCTCGWAVQSTRSSASMFSAFKVSTKLKTAWYVACDVIFLNRYKSWLKLFRP